MDGILAGFFLSCLIVGIPLMILAILSLVVGGS